MSHELTINKGRAEMAYADETPWHGLGQKLDAGADMDAWRVAAGMDWTIEHSAISYRTPALERPISIFPGKRVLMRSDNNEALSVVSDRYKPVQPAEALDFFTNLVAEQGFTMHTAGTLFGGKKFWALAKMEEERFVRKNKDGIGGYVLLCTSCDGSMATTAKFTSIAVVCNNTLSMSLSEKDDDRVRVPHNAQFDIDAVHEKLGLAKADYDAMMAAATILAKKDLSGPASEDFIRFLFANSRLKTDRAIEDSKPFQTIKGLFDGAGMGADLDTRRGTAWGMLNAVTEYVDHHAGARTVDQRLNSAWFGSGNSIKNAAAKALLELC